MLSDCGVLEMSHLELHPLCSLFPRMSGADFDAIKADIQAHGLNQPITVLDGLILDGGNRYRACLDLGIEPTTVTFSGGDPVAFVLSANLHRRHLSAGQSAAIVAAAQDWTTAHGHGGDRKSEQRAILPLASIADRATAAGVSERTQKDADKVARTNPELVRQVAHGEITLPQAVAVIRPKVIPEAAPEPEYNPTEDDLLVEYEREVAANALLQTRIDALTKDDLAAELDVQLLKYDQLSGRLQQEITTCNEAKKQAKYQAELLGKIRKTLNVDKNSEILGRLQGGAS